MAGPTHGQPQALCGTDLGAKAPYAPSGQSKRGHGFAAIFTMAVPQAQNGPTDMFFARIGPG